MDAFAVPVRVPLQHVQQRRRVHRHRGAIRDNRPRRLRLNRPLGRGRRRQRARQIAGGRRRSDGGLADVAPERLLDPAQQFHAPQAVEGQVGVQGRSRGDCDRPGAVGVLLLGHLAHQRKKPRRVLADCRVRRRPAGGDFACFAHKPSRQSPKLPANRSDCAPERAINSVSCSYSRSSWETWFRTNNPLGSGLN